jgi:hypothetical protein
LEGALMDWYKAYQDGILRGSLSRSSNTTQLIWLKLLAIENETRLRDGWLHFKEGQPMTREYLAAVCGVTLEELNIAINEFIGDIDRDGHSRIIIKDDGDIFIKNWEKYQAKPEKIVAKEIAIDRAKMEKERQKTVLDSLAHSVNLLNGYLKRTRYQLQGEDVLDIETGQLIDINTLKINEVKAIDDAIENIKDKAINKKLDDKQIGDKQA